MAQVPMGHEPGADPELIALNDRRVAESRAIALNAFSMSDANKDDRLDRDEWRWRSWLTYDRFDGDSSDSLDWTEYQNRNCGGYAPRGDQFQWCVGAARRQFRSLATRDLVQRGTIADRSMRDFRRLDLNRDGFVTREEEIRASQAR